MVDLGEITFTERRCVLASSQGAMVSFLKSTKCQHVNAPSLIGMTGTPTWNKVSLTGKHGVLVQEESSSLLRRIAVGSR
jgi:hypothetical protein